MEHVTITTLVNGFYKMIPDNGYKLYNRYNEQYYSEAVTKDINIFVAVESGDDPTPPTPVNPLEEAKAIRLALLAKYDTSSAVNGFTVGGVELWIPADKRAILRTSIEAYKALGEQSVTKVWEGVEYTFPTDTWIYMINSVEVYASECFNTTERHRAAISALSSVADVEAYDFTTGYPEKPSFNLV